MPRETCICIAIDKSPDTHYLISLETSDESGPVHLKSSHDVERHMVPGGMPIQSGKVSTEITSAQLQQFIKHTFGPDDRLQPAKIEVNGRKNRRFVVVLGEDGRQMRILDLDYREGDEKVARALMGGNDDGDDEMKDG